LLSPVTGSRAKKKKCGHLLKYDKVKSRGEAWAGKPKVAAILPQFLPFSVSHRTVPTVFLARFPTLFIIKCGAGD
jgi:hypothetical protein